MTEPTYTITQAQRDTLIENVEKLTRLACVEHIDSPTLALLRSLTPWARPVFGKPGTRDVDVAAAQAAWDAAHPAPSTTQPAVKQIEILDAKWRALQKPLATERAALVAKLQNVPRLDDVRALVDLMEAAKAAADMLAADAQDEWHRGRAAGIEECEKLNAELKAQQVAAPMTPERLQFLSGEYADLPDDGPAFRDGFSAAEAHHGITGATE